ncbi:MAG: hypothetical protein M2R45_00722 [Verrucomicrobia subdivision 3 bacterium]|nr:hypothetical protein [Limisphaerales bacterium]MCS1414395.1 hypothetical protein [Limisphaerales bacterium]
MRDIYRGKKQSKILALAGGLNPIWFYALAREDFSSQNRP